MTKTNARDFVAAARRAGVPAVAITTLDQHALAASLVAAGGPLNGETPALLWDCLRGFTAPNRAGAAVLGAVAPDQKDRPVTDPGDALACAVNLPRGGALVMLGADRHVAANEFVAGVQILRDRYKADGRTLVLVGAHFDLPSELAQDVATHDEPAPSDEEHVARALRLIADANTMREGKAPIPAPDAQTQGRLALALRGLSPFAAEQVLALALRSTGYDLETVWRRKAETVASTQGLGFRYATGVRLADVIGLDALAAWVRRIKAGPRAPAAVLFLDEVEKMTAGAGANGDSSGVTQRVQGQFLSWTAENRFQGIMLVGPPGVGKSYVAEAMANEFEVPLLTANLGDVNGSLVGESERNMRTLRKVVDAVSGGRLLMVSTCNREDGLSPEMRDRFSVGTWFVDTPSAAAQAAMWAWYTGRPEYAGHEFGDAPAQAIYTGRDVMNITESAYAQGCTLREAAATSSTPICVSQAGTVKALRERAHGRYLSAQHPGVYKMAEADGIEVARAVTPFDEAINGLLVERTGRN